MNQIAHKVTVSRKLQGKAYKVLDEDQNVVDVVRCPVVSGMELMTPKQYERITGLSKKTILNLMDQGKLTRYNANGTPKIGNGKTKVLFNYNEYLNLKRM